jgi:uncharacterized membrane protein
MDKAQSHHRFKPWRATTRLAVSTVLGIIVYVGLDRSRPDLPGGILAWDAGVFCFLLLTYRVIADHSIESIRRRAATLDTRASVLMIIVVAAACVSLYGLSLNLDALPGHPTLRVVLAGVTVAGSWSLIHTVFSLHYAHFYYAAPEGGLIFPGGEDPNYYDFLYYGFVIGMTCQVADVQVASSGLRRLTLIHGVLAFVFNTVILAMAVNIGASLLSGPA